MKDKSCKDSDIRDYLGLCARRLSMSCYSDLIMFLSYVLTLFLPVFLSKKNQAPKAMGGIYDNTKR